MAGAKIIAPAKNIALVARSGDMRFPEDACDMIAPFDDATAGQTRPNLYSSVPGWPEPPVSSSDASRSRDGTFRGGFCLESIGAVLAARGCLPVIVKIVCFTRRDPGTHNACFSVRGF